MDAMRQIYESATGDAQSMFQGASERFSEIVQGMKHMAGDMQRELETTRQELRRGILELPQETAESAAQMRRVIVDQIEALAELNRIVARHGREIETTEPSAVVRAARRSRGVQRSPQRRAGPRTYVGNAPPVAPPAPVARRPEGQPPQQRRAAAGAADARAAGPCPDAGQTNWLSDLLTRASREGERAAATARGDARGPRRPRGDRPTRHTHRVAGLALARYRPHDRPRCGGRTVGPLQSRRAQRVHAQALHDAGPEGVRGSARAGTAPTASSSRRSTATSPSSSACSKKSPATTAARWWCAPISPRKPARSTPCWRTPRDGSSSTTAKQTAEIENGRACPGRFCLREADKRITRYAYCELRHRRA